MPPAAKKKKDEEAGGAPGWMVTYGDLMSLLLTFFILLLSFSTISEEAFQEAMMSLRGALGVLSGRESPVPQFSFPEESRPTPKSIEKIARELQRRLQILGREDDVDVELDKMGGLKLSLPNQVLFDTASANLKPESFSVLNSVAQVLSEIPGAFVEVRGHTDSRPLRSQGPFKDNYDLSYGRAKAVWQYMTNASRLGEQQFEMIACGPSQPIASNDTEEGMRENRRVELYVRGSFSDGVLETLRRSIDQMGGQPPAEEAEPGNTAGR